ncbi:MAG: hypothetical protein JWQ43_987 [Glaciihabitans sp.]|nr:hypothetical protein [Glaciihabitans sp.]
MTIRGFTTDDPRVIASRSGLQVITLSDHEWRISDPSRSQRDAISLLGFVQQVGSRFELTALGAPRVRTYFDSLDDAVDHLQHAKCAA